MRKRLGTASVVLLATLLAAAPAAMPAQELGPGDVYDVAARLETEIRRAMLEGSIPSLTIALTNRTAELWSHAFGESNLWAGTPASTNTIYLIGSTFKAQSTVALLQQMEQGKFELDDAVSDHLDGLTIRGEDPNDRITYRHLLTHTSGLPADFGPHLVWGETAPLSLHDYLSDSLRAATPPLRGVVYSNMAYSLVGHLVEKFSGVPYKEYIRENVWGALGMTSTEFDMTPEMEERLSIPYVLDRGSRRPVATDRLKANVWPAGIVYGTVHDQAAWVGYTAFVMGNKTLGIGVALLTNGDRAHPHLVRISSLALDLLAEAIEARR